MYPGESKKTRFSLPASDVLTWLRSTLMLAVILWLTTSSFSILDVISSMKYGASTPNSTQLHKVKWGSS